MSFGLLVSRIHKELQHIELIVTKAQLQKYQNTGDSSLIELNDYRGFRHMVMHRYSSELIPERIAELVEKLEVVFPQAKQELLAFCQFLEQT